MTATLGRASGGALRIVPVGLYARRGHVVIERAYRATKHNWLTVLTGFFEPLFYLLSLGNGLHTLIGPVAGPDGRPIGYTAFIAPALLASSAMNGAIYDSTMNVFFKLKYNKLYDSMLATPLGPLDVAIGEIGWALLRGGIYSAGFLVVMAVMGLVLSWWGLLILPVALLIAFGFAAVGMAVTTYMRGFSDLELVQVVLLPMFLFSGTFYPLSVYPAWLRVVVECLPLHHGIVLLRALSTGVVSWSLLGNAAYFVVMIVVGLAVATRRLGTLLLS